MDIGKLVNTLDMFTYEEPQVLMGRFSVTYNRHDQEALLMGIRPHVFSHTGSCAPLAVDASKMLRTRFPGLHIMISKGTDPNFFMADTSVHYFLSLYDNKLTGHFNHNPLIYDPCFKVCIPYKESGYTIRKTMLPEEFNPGTDVFLKEGHLFPVYMEDADNIVYVGVSFKDEPEFAIGFQTRGDSSVKSFPLSHRYIPGLAKQDKKLSYLVHALKNVSWKETEKKL
jgi:hypothetical protein